MTNKNDGVPAFPMQYADDSWQSGMALRDWFAGLAMQGWLSSYSPGDKHPASCGACAFVAKQAYVMADAMLAARERKS